MGKLWLPSMCFLRFGGPQAKKAALIWGVPFLQWKEEAADVSPTPVLLTPSLSTALGHPSHTATPDVCGGAGSGMGSPSSEDAQQVTEQ